MAILVVFEFPSEGPWGQEMAESYQELAGDIAAENGLVWKVWTEAPERGVAGGVYLFGAERAARAYIAKHAARLRAWGIPDIDVREFGVNRELSRLTGAPVEVTE